MANIYRTKVEFHITEDAEALTLLRERAAEVDDHNIGQHLAHYTDEQAFVVVWHDDPAWLEGKRILVGWVADVDWTDAAEWIDAEES